MKLRNIALTAAALALPGAAAIAASGPSEAATTPVVFAGTLSGDVTGSITISPGLSLSTPSTVPTKFTTHLTASALVASKGLTQKGVTITGAKGTSTVTVAAGIDCTTLATSGIPSATITTKYTSTGTSTAAATKFKPGSTTVALGPPITATLGGTGTTTAGSFKNGTAGSAASNAKLILDDTETQLLAACQATGGLTSIAFTGKSGTSTFTFG